MTSPIDFDDLTVRDIIGIALEKWQVITGVNRSDTSFSFGELDIRSMNRVIDEVLELEPDGRTALMLLEIFLRRFLESKSFTAANIMRDYDALMDFLAKAREMFSIVQSDRAVEEIASFREKMVAGLKHYNADRPEVIEVLDDGDSLPFLRRDALQAIAHLEPFQFLQGEAGTGPAQVIEHVYQAWDVNQLLLALRDMPVNGVAVVLLRDPSHADRSYFCFAMRNGDNVILLTDKSRPAFPGQEDVLAGRGGRGASRNFAKRAWSNHFPYQLIKTSVDEDTGDLKFDAETAPAAAGLDLVPLMRIQDLPPFQAIWLTMMLSLVSEKFWKNAWQAEELSYTARMIRKKDLMVSAADGAKLPVAQGYSMIELEDVRLEELTAEAMDPQVEGKTTRVNAWLEARYRDQVPHEVINLWDAKPDEMIYLPSEAGVSEGDLRGSRAIAANGVDLGGGAIAVKKTGYASVFDKPRGYALQTFSSGAFGTEEELRQDRLFIARHNMARFIERAADEEFHARKDEIKRWYLKALEKNTEGLIEIFVDHLAGTGTFSRNENGWRTLRFGKKRSNEFNYTYTNTNVLGEVIPGKWEHRCLLTDAASAPWRVLFQPINASDIAAMTGCEVEDLPDVLQNWVYEKPRVGNNLLNRIDPVESQIDDPWIRLDVSANIYLSKTGLSRLEKRAELKKETARA
ncbi:MAG: hypothetical protein ABJN42_31660 [Roseibium sp.]|uniref:hypothetical protein n=1 Tax=Roseibium sp. TaxID=1936156 RepID=UPI0032989D78